MDILGNNDYVRKEDAASKGNANAGLGLGIAGTALGLLAMNGNGGGLGLFGGGRQEKYDVMQAEKISGLQAALAQQSSERFTEQATFANYKEIMNRIEREGDIRDALAKDLEIKFLNHENRIAVQEARNEAKFEAFKENIIETRGLIREMGNTAKENLLLADQTLKNEFKAALALATQNCDCNYNNALSQIQLEAERRKAGDTALYEWVESHFARNKKVIPAENICPSVMPRYNSWVEPTTVATPQG